MVLICVSLIGLYNAIGQELIAPQGVRLLDNKRFDDSEASRQEILELYKDLRVTDVCDGMDLVGLQDYSTRHGYHLEKSLLLILSKAMSKKEIGG